MQNCPYKTLKNDFRITLTHLLSMHCYALSANGSASKHYDAVKQSLFWAVQPGFSGTIKIEIRMNDTQPVWTLFLFKSILTCSQGVKKSFFFTNKTVEFLP